MASRTTKVKKVAFLAGSAGSVFMFCCGIFWMIMAIVLVPFLNLFHAKQWLIVLFSAVCALIAVVLFICGAVALKKFKKLSADNNRKAQEEDALEYERDFTLVVCDRCNGTNKVRKGTIVECQYCSNHVQG